MERQQAPDLVESVLDLAGLSEQIMAHMARWGGQSAPDAPPPDQVFRDLVGGILHPLVEHYSPPASKPRASSWPKRLRRSRPKSCS
jgi:hypothetical protein